MRWLERLILATTPASAGAARLIRNPRSGRTRAHRLNRLIVEPVMGGFPRLRVFKLSQMNLPHSPEHLLNGARWAVDWRRNEAVQAALQLPPRFVIGSVTIEGYGAKID